MLKSLRQHHDILRAGFAVIGGTVGHLQLHDYIDGQVEILPRMFIAAFGAFMARSHALL